MKVGLQTWGSSGDCRPMIALAGALGKAGHDVRLAVTAADNMDYQALSANLGVNITMVPEHIDFDIRKFMHTFGSVRNNITILKTIFDEVFFPYCEAMYEAAPDLAADSDVIVSHFAVHPARAAATETGTPYIAIAFWPGFIPTRTAPPYRLPNLGPANPLLWKLVWVLLDLFLKKKVARFYREKDLPPFKHLIPDVWLSDRLNLIAASPSLWPEAPDWPPLSRMCGFFDVPADAEPWRPGRALEEFLKAGEPPVYMCFGTPQYLDPDNNTHLMRDAARIGRFRAVVQSTSADHPPGSTEDGIYYIDRTPHESVFPLCGAVVHHGGAGTTHTAARSGHPSVVVGFSDEQISWGRQLYKAGVAPKPLWRKTATAAKIARAVRSVLDSTEMQVKSAELSSKMRAEDGTAAAIRILEKFLGTSPAP